MLKTRVKALSAGLLVFLSVLLPVVLISMLLIINKKDVMGAHVNRPLGNIIGWTTAAVLLGMNAVFLGMSIFGRK
jgi:Mn2+/Fe2+ NRAMP family transporter